MFRVQILLPPEIVVYWVLVAKLVLHNFLRKSFALVSYLTSSSSYPTRDRAGSRGMIV